MAPERAALTRRAALTSALALFYFVFPFAPVAVLVLSAIVAALLAAIALKQRNAPALQLGVFTTLLLGAWALPFGFSQLTFGATIAVYVIAARTLRPLHGALGWAQRGVFDRRVVALIVATVVLSSAALIMWYVVARPDVRDLVQQFLPHTPVKPVLLVLGAFAFSMVNAAVEEVVYRGVLLHSLDAAFGVSAVVVQGIAFGVLHVNGFPRGWIGVGLAAIYGVMLGVIRRWSRGMWAPWIAHVFADVTIIGILVILAS